MPEEGGLAGRVAIVTGAGRGLGREHALLLARQGARVVVNDLGTSVSGSGSDLSVADQVVKEIKAFGGEAVSDANDIADWGGARRLIQSAIDAFGNLDVLINNGGFLRDRMFVNMREDDWDEVIRVHLKGHAAPSHWAATYWRERSKFGHPVRASIVNTSSHAGLVGQPGQSNYAAAKAGIAGLTITLAIELGRYGVRVNAISPAARTRMTDSNKEMRVRLAPPADGAKFDSYDPANVSPLVAYLATPDCPLTGQVFWITGGDVILMQGWSEGPRLQRQSPWTLADLARELPNMVDGADEPISVEDG
jgi:NAD(P)-dependent dehydrogenase (short-subunit alcohol dehydrogenase family)